MSFVSLYSTSCLCRPQLLLFASSFSVLLRRPRDALTLRTYDISRLETTWIGQIPYRRALLAVPVSPVLQGPLPTRHASSKASPLALIRSQDLVQLPKWAPFRRAASPHLHPLSPDDGLLHIVLEAAWMLCGGNLRNVSEQKLEQMFRTSRWVDLR